MPPMILRRTDHPVPQAPQGAGRAAGGGTTPRRDPAPSRLAYRLHRLWLTPNFHRFLRYGLPACVVVGALAGYFGSAERRADLVARYDAIRHEIETRPEFMVTMISIDGASAPLAQAIRQVLDLKLPQSSFDLNLPALQARVEGLDAVASADLQVGTGGVLHVNIVARKGAVVWRGPQGLELLDASGHRVAALVDRAVKADLPLIAGAGADAAVPEALALFAAAGPLKSRIRGLVRMGERRWNVILDRDQTIELPETGAVAALERVIAFDRAQKLLSRAVTVVDMRNSARPTVRLTPEAMNLLRQRRQAAAEGKNL